MPPSPFARMRVSATLRAKVWAARAQGQKQAAIAIAADIHPTTLSALLNGNLLVRLNDPRVLRLAGVLGVQPSEAFAADRPERARP